MKPLLATLLMTSLLFGQKLPDNLPQLKAAAAKKGLHWTVACTPTHMSREEEFMAYAEIPGHSSSLYIEEGGKPDWFVYGATQREAIAHLINALNSPPNLSPRHKPKEEMEAGMHHKQCPPPLEGGAQ